MAASHDTVRAIAEVVRRHVDEATWRAILDDLAEVTGNKSFRDTIARLRELRR